MSDLPQSSRSPPVGTIILLAAAGLLYVMMMANLTDLSGTDAAGRGLAQAFAALVGFVLWVVLAILLVVAAVNGRMPVWAAIGWVFALPLSAVACVYALDLHDSEHGWPILVPALVPPLVALYALWARLPALHAKLPPMATSAVVGIAMLALIAAPLGAAALRSLPDPERQAKLAEQEKARLEKERQEEQVWRAREEAKFASLGPDSSLKDYLDYSGSHAQEAISAIKLVKSRQVDAVTMLQQGRIRDLMRLTEFDIAPTAELCAAFGAALGGAAGQVDKSVRSDYLTAAIDLEGQLPNIRWLIGAQCDLGEPLGLLETKVRAVADSSRMTKFADTVAELRQRR